MKKYIALLFAAAVLGSHRAPATLLRFQEGVWNGTNSAAVTYNVQDARTFPGGGDSDLTVRRFGSGYFISEFRFDLTEAALTGRQVKDVTLTLHVNSAFDLGAGGGTHDVRALPAGNTNWLETTATGAVQAPGVTWKLANGSAAADSWNGAIFGTLLGTKTFSATPANGDFVTYSLDAAVVNQWLTNPAGYPGFAIVQPNDDPFNLVFFDASEVGTSSFRPLLEMTLVPEPSVMWLLLSGISLVWWRRPRRG